MARHLVHGLCPLGIGLDGGALPSASAGRAVEAPADLPEAEVDLHWFEDSDRAEAFVQGVKAAGVNTVSVAQGEDRLAVAVVLTRYDRGPREGVTLEEAVALIDHGGGESAVWENLNRAAWARITEELPSIRAGLSLHWRTGQGAGSIEGMSQRMFILREGEGYLLRPFSWDARRAFDGSYGRADTKDVKAILASHRGEIVPAGLWSTPPTVDLHVRMPFDELAGGIARMEGLLADLGAVHAVRKKNHDRKKLRLDPAARRAAQGIKEGLQFRREGRKLFLSGAGRKQEISMVLIRRMADAGMIGAEVVERVPPAS